MKHCKSAWSFECYETPLGMCEQMVTINWALLNLVREVIWNEWVCIEMQNILFIFLRKGFISCHWRTYPYLSFVFCFRQNATLLPPVPTYPTVQNNFRDYSSNFNGRSYEMKTRLTGRCTWKCIALIFIFLTTILATLLVYFLGIVGNRSYLHLHQILPELENLG